MISKKRKAAVIDLTEDESPSKVPKSSQLHHSKSAQHTHSKSTIVIDSDDSEYDFEEISQQQFGDGWVKYGSMDEKIVGTQYYRGRTTIGEHVILRREPNNKYDVNAIRVDNMAQQQIGHIPRRHAAKIAPFMDDDSLLVEGTIVGAKGYDCPITLSFYGPADPVLRSALKERMKSEKLPTKELVEHERQEKKEKAEREKAEKAKERERKAWEKSNRVAAIASVVTGDGDAEWDENGQPQFVGSEFRSVDKGLSLEDIVGQSEEYSARGSGDFGKLFGFSEEAMAKLPHYTPPAALKTTMLPYQRQGLHWLVSKENPTLPQQGSNKAVQLWLRKQNHYTNVATNFSVEVPPKLARGGILADDMGLGKTMQIIALILADKNLKQNDSTCGATLIVSPAGVMSNWTNQIERHVKHTHALKVHVYHGEGKRNMTTKDFAKYDVVITTYTAMAMEFVPRGSKKPPPFPRAQGLYAPTWRRVVLDEAHQIRNPRTKASLAANALQSWSYWALTGTPIINTLKDLYSLCRFMKLTGGLENLDVFNRVLTRPFKQRDVEASVLLHALMDSICLRRKKEMKFVDLRLPELREFVHKIPFSDFEKPRYDALFKEACGLLKRVSGTKNGKGQPDYRNLLEILLRLRQMCNHHQLCPDRVEAVLKLASENKAVELTPKNVAALQDLLQISIDSGEECPVCLENLHEPVITACTHVFGLSCIEKVIEHQHKCPMCRAELENQTSLVKPRLDLGENVAINIDTDSSSTKVEAILNILKASAKKDGVKTIVFSQWTSFLNIVEKQLYQLGIGFTRIDGSMKIPERDEAQRVLENEPECKVMLASLAVCSVGLNLVAANQVILCDSWWAPAIEDQAVDRVHRLGQTRPTTVFKLVMEDSIEERVLQIQAEKRELASTAFRDTGKARGGATARFRDITKLLSDGSS